MSRAMAVTLSLIFLGFLLLSGCLPGDGAATPSKPAGFLWGVWHGWVAPISLIVKVFNPSIRIYEPINTGFWYDLGYYMAIVGGFGGLSFARKRGSDKR